MLPEYHDILSRIHESPKWWDNNGVPRFCDFEPAHAASIYADEVVLLEIACQNCHRLFNVEINSDLMTIMRGSPKLCEQVLTRQIHYGDPPRHEHDNCAAGNSMNCIDLKVLEFWRRGNFKTDQGRWVRVPEFELEIQSLEEWDDQPL